MDVNDVQRITLYHKGCFGCDRKNIYRPLHRFILKQAMPLSSLKLKRIELSQRWATEAREYETAIGAPLPIIVFDTLDDNDDYQQIVMAYNEFIRMRSEHKTSTKKTHRATEND